MSKYARVFGKSGAGDLMRNCSSGRVLRPVCPPRGGLDPSAAAGGFTRGLEGSLLLADWTKAGSEAKLASCLHPLESSLMTVEPFAHCYLDCADRQCAGIECKVQMTLEWA